jgi:dTDP-4-dehydrorhamnose 3,5-epimerase
MTITPLAKTRLMKLDVIPLSLSGARLIRAKRYLDQRGYFAETYVRRDFADAGIGQEFVQDNQSCSSARGTVRGLHFQIPPFAQAKLVRVLRGRILDVVVDLRRASPSYGRHLSVELGADSGDQLYVPAGFAHGFCTLVADTEVLYKVDAVYSAEHDRGVNWADPALGIAWPVSEADAVLSPKDAALPALRDLMYYFD